MLLEGIEHDRENAYQNTLYDYSTIQKKMKIHNASSFLIYKQINS